MAQHLVSSGKPLQRDPTNPVTQVLFAVSLLLNNGAVSLHLKQPEIVIVDAINSPPLFLRLNPTATLLEMQSRDLFHTLCNVFIHENDKIWKLRGLAECGETDPDITSWGCYLGNVMGAVPDMQNWC